MIRGATEDDVLAMQEMENACFPDPWSGKAIRGTMREAGGFFLVAELGKRLAGYLNASFILDECNLNRICVLPEQRKTGMGAEMMAELVKKCREMGTVRIVLEVRKSNIAAQRLYERFGFVLLGERANFYENPTEAGLIMELVL